jgi:hypothetical protein
MFDVHDFDRTRHFLVRPSQQFLGLPVLHRKIHKNVHTFPNIIKVAVPSPQHSPMFGQLPEVQIIQVVFIY